MDIGGVVSLHTMINSIPLSTLSIRFPCTFQPIWKAVNGPMNWYFSNSLKNIDYLLSLNNHFPRVTIRSMKAPTRKWVTLSTRFENMESGIHHLHLIPISHWFSKISSYVRLLIMENGWKVMWKAQEHQQ